MYPKALGKPWATMYGDIEEVSALHRNRRNFVRSTSGSSPRVSLALGGRGAGLYAA